MLGAIGAMVLALGVRRIELARRTPAATPAIVTPVNERLEADIQTGFPAGPAAVALGSPIGARLASVDAVAATPLPGRRELSVFGTLHVSRR